MSAPLTIPSDLPDDLPGAAAAYAAAGWPVFPCKPGGKAPATRHGVKDATTDADTVAAWWAKTPTANIGLAMGGGVVAVDLDGADGAASFAALEAEHGPAPATLTSTTGSGRHLLFACPDGVQNSAGRLGAGIDTRGPGGYIVVAPSVHPSGVVYAWASLPPPADLPAWLNPRSVTRQTEPAPPLPRTAPSGERTLERAAAYLAKMPAAVSGSGGHGALYAAATAMVHGFGLPEPEALKLLAHDYNHRCAPPWSDAELRHKVDDASNKPHDKPRGWLLNASDRDDARGAEVGQRAAADLLANHTTQAGHAGAPACRPVLLGFDTIEPEGVRWLWPGRIAEGRLTTLAGAAGLGKSYLTADIAATVSRGRDWPDGTPCRAGSVLMLCAEDDPKDTTLPRLIAQDADRASVKALVAVREAGRRGKPTEKVVTLADLEPIAAALDAMPDCRLLIVDPIGSYVGGGVDTHKDNETRAVLAPLMKLAEERGVAVLAVAHLRKSAVTAADDAVMGSRAFTALARVVLHLAADPDDEAEDRDPRRLLVSGKNNLARKADGLAFNIRGDGQGRLWWDDAPVTTTAEDVYARQRTGTSGKNAGAADGPRAEAAEFLREALSPGARLSRDLFEEAKESHNITERTLRRAKKDMGVVAYRTENPGPWWWRLPTASPLPGDKNGGHLASCPDDLKNGDSAGDGGGTRPDGQMAMLPGDDWAGGVTL